MGIKQIESHIQGMIHDPDDEPHWDEADYLAVYLQTDDRDCRYCGYAEAVHGTVPDVGLHPFAPREEAAPTAWEQMLADDARALRKLRKNTPVEE